MLRKVLGVLCLLPLISLVLTVVGWFLVLFWEGALVLGGIVLAWVLFNVGADLLSEP